MCSTSSRAPSTYEIEADVLTLTNGDSGLTYRAAE